MNLIKNTIFCTLFFPCLCAASESNFFSDDNALIKHIKNTDYIFTTALGNCKSDRVIRINNNFEYYATCIARAANESDCPEYKVIAKGTIDTKIWATVRKLEMELQCHG